MIKPALLVLSLSVAGAASAAAAVVDPNCANYPPEDHDPVARDRSVVLFHNACGTALPSRCRLDHNPSLLTDPEGLADCKEDAGEIAEHVLRWYIPHACSGNQACADLHWGLCLGKANRLQLRRRLLRCSAKARTKLDNWSAELLGSRR